MYLDARKFIPEELLVYDRKSRSDDPMLTTEEVLERHEKILNEWIENHLDGPIPEENWHREVVSGETIANRPEMQKVLRKIESPQYKAILCVDCSRLSRGDLEDCGRMMKLLRYTETVVITPMKIFDLADKFDREIFESELKRGNSYLEYTKGVLYTGRFLSAKSGFYLGSNAPYGYDKIWVMDGKKKRPSLAINEQEAEVVRMIFDMYVNQRLGVQAIANRLDKMGITPRNGKMFSRSTVRDVIRNEHVMGKVVWKRRPLTKVVENSEIISKRELSEDKLIFEGKHEAIIDEETFRIANKIYNTSPKINIDFTLKNPLSTIMYCQCGNIMTMNGSSSRKPRYRCKYYTKCQTASVEMQPVIDAVCKTIEQEIENYEVKLNQSEEQDQKQKRMAIENLEKRINDCEAKEVALWEKYTMEAMPKHIFDQLIAKNSKEKEEASKKLEAMKETIIDKSDYENAIATLSDALNALRDGKASAEKQNALLKACIKRITYSREAPVRVNGKEYKGKTLNGWTVPDFKLHIEFMI